jgi:hypothetical protein
METRGMPNNAGFADKRAQQPKKKTASEDVEKQRSEESRAE